MVRALCVVLAVASMACGGRGAELAPGDAGSTTDAMDGAAEVGSGTWSQCATPDGVALCGASCGGETSACTCVYPDAGLQLCATPGDRLCGLGCDADQVCAAYLPPPSSVLFCEPWNAGQLFAQNGAADRVWYSDFSPWQGPDISDPGACPVLDAGAGVVLCGGSCGDACPQGQRCTGRSPLHPFGWCALDPVSNSTCGGPNDPVCASPSGCFRYTVLPADQPFADAHGYCLDGSLCGALAAGLPGGGTCTQ